MKEKRISLAFDLIRQYAERQGWIPVGHRVFRVGDWKIEINGTHRYFAAVPSLHACVSNQTHRGTMLMSPYGGKVRGYKDTEAEFIAAMRAAIDALPKEKNHGEATAGVS